MTHYTRLLSGFVAALVFAVPVFLQAQQHDAQGQQVLQQQQQQNGNTQARVAPGQSVQIEGVILRHDPNSLLVRDDRGGDYPVTLSGNTEIKEKKSNPFRGAKNYTQQQLLQGMTVQVSGRGGDAGNLIAYKIRFTNTDLRVAEAIDTRVSPVEQNLSQTTNRLSQAELNAQRMSGQFQELSSVANAARGAAKAAQDGADNAQEAANNARESANRANDGVSATNTRISSIDDYQVKNTATVGFKVGSAVLSRDAQVELDKIAQNAKNEKAYVIEVSGFASSDGPIGVNQRLSQRRADEVIRYLAENYDIPLRRFITPMGLGTTHPIADNSTRAGRQENRRVEVKVLVSKGLTQSAGSTSGGESR